MKKIVSYLLLAVLVLGCFAAFAGCNTTPKEPVEGAFIGTYLLDSALSEGITLTRQQMIDNNVGDMSYTFKSDGKVNYAIGETTGTGDFKKEGDVVTISIGGQVLADMTLDGDTLALTTGGVIFYLKKQ